MYEPVFELASFGTLPLEARKHLIGVACEFLIAVNREWLKRNPGCPDFYTIAPKYALKLRPFGLDRWQDIPQTIALREGDCKDFTCWRVAQLREQGVADCGPRILASESAGLVAYHVQVRNDVKVEDPSVAMGMPKNLSSSQLKSLFTTAPGQQAGIQSNLHGTGDGNIRNMPTNLPAAQQPIVVTATEFQTLLRTIGAQPAISVTTVFDPQTTAAIKAFQSKVGLKATGNPTPRTLLALRAVAGRTQAA